MNGGRIAEHGTYEDLVSNDGEFARLDKEFGGTDPNAESEAKPVTVNSDAVEEAKHKSDDVTDRGAGAGRLEGKLIVNEKRSTGSVSWSSKSQLLLYIITTLMPQSCSLWVISCCRKGIHHSSSLSDGYIADAR